MSDSFGIVTKVKQKKISELLIQDKRLDGRGLEDYREIKVETGLIGKAVGSAQVSLGKTKVLVGIKVESGAPFPDTPNEGVLTVNVELVPLASPSFEPGAPNEDAIELARVVDRGLRESKAVDTKKLCVIPGKKVFVVFVDIYVLDHDGNLFDSSALASIVALATSKIKGYTVDKASGEIEFKSDQISLPIQNYPIEVTMAKMDDKLVVDPSLDEEEVVDAQITIATGKNDEICAIQKSKSGAFTVNEILQAVTIATKKANELRGRFLEGTKNE